MPKFNVPIDLTTQELRNAVIQVLASDPGTGKAGQIYYNSGTNALKLCTNATGPVWTSLSTGTTPDATTGAKGIVQLAGDLAGSGTAAAAPLIGSVSQLVNGVVGTPSVRFAASQTTGMWSSAVNVLDFSANGVKCFESSGTATTLPLSTTASAGLTVTTGGLTVSGGGAAITGNSSITGTLNMNSNLINNVTNPVSAQDAATKSYVDSTAQGLAVKPAARAATAAETLTIVSGSVTQITGTTVDGITLAIGDRVLIPNAPAATGAAAGSGYANFTTQPANGLYIVTANTTNLTVSRDTSMSGTAGPAGAFVFVDAGAAAQSGFTVNTPTTNTGFTYGTNNISWTQFSGAGEITAGTGLSKSGNTLSIENSGVLLPAHGGTGVASPTAHGVLVAEGASAAVSVAPSATSGLALVSNGSSADPSFTALNLTATGAVTNALPIANGGTAATTAAAARTSLAACAVDTTTLASGQTSYTFTPAPAPKTSGAWQVTLINQSTGAIEYADVVVNQSLNTPVTGPVNQITVTFAATTAVAYTLVAAG